MARPIMAPARQNLRTRPLPEWCVSSVLAVTVILIACVPRLIDNRFYYTGDMLESFVPSWHRIGSELRSGHWLAMNPDAWVGGNYAGEAAYGLYNPINLVNYVLTSYFENLSEAAFVIMVEFLALFAVATYLLCREYGANRGPAVLAGLTLPFSGFTLFYEAGGWPSGMMAVAWVTLFWWSALKLARSRTNPFITFIVGALTVSMGNPYAALGAVIVLVGLGVELLLTRRFRRLILLALTGACAGTAALVTYMPLLLSVDVTTRAGNSGISNDTFLQPQLGGLAGLSSPTYLPVITTFGGPIEVLPSFYLAWFVLPLLPFLRWEKIRRLLSSSTFRRRHGVHLISLASITGVFFLLTFGPSNVGMFRWPIRLIEYFYLGAIVALSLAMSLGLAKNHIRRRLILSSMTVFLGFYVAFSSSPALTGRHALAAVLVLALGALAFLSWHRWNTAGLFATLTLGSIAMMSLQVIFLGRDVDESSRPDPSSTTQLSKRADDYVGTVLQIADREDTEPADITNGRLLFGNEILASTVDSSINSYTGIGFTVFQDALCMDYRGSVCREFYPALWSPVNKDVPIPLIDYLRVDTLVIQDALVPKASVAPAPPGWEVKSRDDIRTVMVRKESSPLPGTVSYAGSGVTVSAGDSNAQTETVQVSGSGGQVSFARLAWPGYSASIDGVETPAGAGWHGLLQVSVPPGQHELAIEFRPPLQRLSAAVFAVAFVLALGVGVASTVFRRKFAGHQSVQ